MLMKNVMSVTATKSAWGNADKAQNRPKASVAPTGAENTALKIVASTAEASRTSPVLCRTKSPPFPASEVLATGVPPRIQSELRPLDTARRVRR